MKAVGIVAEFNPFHNGHAYIISEARRRTGCDFVVVIMSGDFVQRGEPAMADKFLRAKTALEGGADVVIELPSLAASAGAAYFADTAVSTLAHTGVISHLCFGSESADLDTLSRAAFLLDNESEPFSNTIRHGLKSGLSYPAARSRALGLMLSNKQNQTNYNGVLSSPNDILAVEYLRALNHFKKTIQPVAVSRQGNAYHDLSMASDFSSASALRAFIFQNSNNKQVSNRTYMLCEGAKAAMTCNTISSNTADINKTNHPLTMLQDCMPSGCFLSLQSWLNQMRPVSANDFSQMLAYALLQCDDYSGFLDVSDDLSHRILKYRHTFENYYDFIDLLKTKNITRASISRALLHILLQHRPKDMQILKDLGCAPYIRLLGFRRSASPLLRCIQDNADIPVITKPADAKTILSDTGIQIFNHDIKAARLYRTASASGSHMLPDELMRSPVIL